MLLQPHHILCINFFENKGYNDSFTKNMKEFINYLNDDSTITLATISTSHTDPICRKCPRMILNRCADHEKTEAYDKKTLRLTALSTNITYTWKKLKTQAIEKIIQQKKLHQICPDCCYFHICSQKCEKYNSKT